MSARAWQHVVVQAPMAVATQVLPDLVTAGHVTLEIGSERLFVPGSLAEQARRVRSSWSRGRTVGGAYVELLPHVREWTTEVVVHLEAPRSRIARLLWSPTRVRRAALGLALALRQEMDARAATHPLQPVAPAPAWVRTLEPRTA